MTKPDWFASAPDAIGPVLAAHTTLQMGVRPYTELARAFIAFCSAAVGFGIAYVLKHNSVVMPEGAWALFWSVALPMAGVGVAYSMTAYHHSCYYLGTLGLAEFTLRGVRDSEPAGETFLFREAEYVLAQRIEHSLNGTPQRNSAKLTWYLNRQQIFRFSGDDGILENWRLNLAWEAETAWSKPRIVAALAALTQGETLEFKCPGFFLSLNRDQLHFRKCSYEVKDLVAVRIEKGRIAISARVPPNPHSRARVSVKDVLDFEYSDVPNAMVMVAALDFLIIPTKFDISP